MVVTTGESTYFGSLAQAPSTAQRAQTSFDRGIHRFSWLLIRFMAVMVPMVFLINGLTKARLARGVPVRDWRSRSA